MSDGKMPNDNVAQDDAGIFRIALAMDIKLTVTDGVGETHALARALPAEIIAAHVEASRAIGFFGGREIERKFMAAIGKAMQAYFAPAFAESRMA